MKHLIPQNAIDAIRKTGGNIYIVGGSVRDEMFGFESKDLDILVTGIEIDNLKAILLKDGVVDEVGKVFGILKWSVPGLKEPIDVALPRKEISTGESHIDFHVEFDHRLSVEDDLSRRDFTINAIAKDLFTDKIIDPFLGMKDIESKTLRVVGKKSFEEDPLRILRGLQFVSRFGLLNTCIGEMRTHSFRLKSISPERISIELWKWLAKSPHPENIIAYMDSTSVWKNIFDFGINDMSTLEMVNKTVAHALEMMPMDPDIRLAAILSYAKMPVGKTVLENAEEVFEKLKLSSAGFDKKKVLKLVENSDFSKGKKLCGSKTDLRKFVALRLNGDMALFSDLICLWAGSGHQKKYLGKLLAQISQHAFQIILNKDPLKIKDLCIDGNDVVEKGFVGKGIGIALKHLLEIVLEDPKENTKENLLLRL